MYFYKSEPDFKVFEFISEGPKGKIRKMVQYTKTNTTNVFNLAFGDFNAKTKTIDDIAVTNNGDSIKVLATVASTVYVFIEQYPEAWIFATGSTETRTRLYRMGITNNLAEIKELFAVFGLLKDGTQGKRI